MPPPPAPPPLRVFFVCTGNQARSPLAAAWTARALAPLTVQVGSAGTFLGPPRPVLPETLALAAEAGIDLSGHVSSHVSAYDLSIADLVVGFELQHVAAAVVEGGADAGRAFLLKELVVLLEEVSTPPMEPHARVRELVHRADALRRERRGFTPGQEIKDPVGRRSREALDILGEVTRACDLMCALLCDRSPRFN